MADVKQRMIDIVNSVPDNYFDGLKPTEMVFKLMRERICEKFRIIYFISEKENTVFIRYIFSSRQDKRTFFEVHKSEIYNFFNPYLF